MTKKTIEQDVILKRINGIQREIAELEQLAKTPFDEFNHDNSIGFRLSQYHLHRALEGVFHISAHILSRIPGAQATEYQEMARKMGEFGIIEEKFANEQLVKMAKYRNRLVHFYAEIGIKEIYDILHRNLGDFNIFLSSIKKVLANSEQFGMEIE